MVVEDDEGRFSVRQVDRGDHLTRATDRNLQYLRAVLVVMRWWSKDHAVTKDASQERRQPKGVEKQERPSEQSQQGRRPVMPRERFHENISRCAISVPLSEAQEKLARVDVMFPRIGCVVLSRFSALGNAVRRSASHHG